MEASIILGILTVVVLAFTIVKKQSQDSKLQKSDETLDDIYATDEDLKELVEFQEDIVEDYLDRGILGR